MTERLRITEISKTIAKLGHSGKGKSSSTMTLFKQASSLSPAYDQPNTSRGGTWRRTFRPQRGLATE